MLQSKKIPKMLKCHIDSLIYVVLIANMIKLRQHICQIQENIFLLRCFRTKIILCTIQK